MGGGQPLRAWETSLRQVFVGRGRTREADWRTQSEMQVRGCELREGVGVERRGRPRRELGWNLLDFSQREPSRV